MINGNGWLAGLMVAGAALGIAAAVRGRRWLRPVDGPISSPFGPRQHPVTGEFHDHNGIDIAAPLGTPILSPSAGEVVSVYRNDVGGLQVVVNLDNGYRVGFAHLDTSSVLPEQRVAKGDELGTVGMSGRATGPHLHFTVRNPDGEFMNPEDFIA